MKRLVISGHHWPPYSGERVDVVWGDSGKNWYALILTVTGDLKGLHGVFPNAMQQVEDLAFSACRTAVPWARSTTASMPQLLEVLPNLQTVWGYFDIAPTGAQAVSDLLAWERASQLPKGKEALIAACRKQPTVCNLWERNGDRIAANPRSMKSGK